MPILARVSMVYNYKAPERFVTAGANQVGGLTHRGLQGGDVGGGQARGGGALGGVGGGGVGGDGGGASATVRILNVPATVTAGATTLL